MGGTNHQKFVVCDIAIPTIILIRSLNDLAREVDEMIFERLTSQLTTHILKLFREFFGGTFQGMGLSKLYGYSMKWPRKGDCLRMF